MMHLFNSVTPIQVHTFICVAYFVFGFAPILAYWSAGWVTCLKKVRMFYIIIGLGYLALILSEHAHHQQQEMQRAVDVVSTSVWPRSFNA